MRKLSFILAVLMIMTSLFAFAACTKDTSGDDKGSESGDKEVSKVIEPEDAVLKDMVAAIEKKAPYADYVAEMLYKESDPDEMVCWTYGVVDINAYDLISDYVITMPSDYSQTLAILKFEDGMTDADFQEVKDAITHEYIKVRASQLQMYMPEEYGHVEWAVANPDKIWRQYGDNMLVLAIYGGEEPTAVWDAIDTYLAGK